MGIEEIKRFILLDRDGVLNEDSPDYVKSIQELKLIPTSQEAIRLLTKAGFKILVITNQACIGKGLVSLEKVIEIHKFICRRLNEIGGNIEEFFICVHTSEQNCNCRKPLPGLIITAQNKWKFDPSDTWMVGDSIRDIAAARATGCKPALISTDKYNDIDLIAINDVPVYPSLLDFVTSQLKITN